jgi:hypothetical protein
MTNSGPMPRTQCGVCRRDVPVTAGAKDVEPAPRLRRHQVVPGGQLECVGSGQHLDAAPQSRMPRRRTEQELARWIGPRRWEDAGL